MGREINRAILCAFTWKSMWEKELISSADYPLIKDDNDHTLLNLFYFMVIVESAF